MSLRELLLVPQCGRLGWGGEGLYNTYLMVLVWDKGCMTVSNAVLMQSNMSH